MQIDNKSFTHTDIYKKDESRVAAADLSASMSLDELKAYISAVVKQRGFENEKPQDIMLLMVEEVGELARIMARKYGDQSFKNTESDKDLADEMADVLWVLICLANQTGVDLTHAFIKNMEKKTARDAERHKENEKLR